MLRHAATDVEYKYTLLSVFWIKIFFAISKAAYKGAEPKYYSPPVMRVTKVQGQNIEDSLESSSVLLYTKNRLTINYKMSILDLSKKF